MNELTITFTDVCVLAGLWLAGKIAMDIVRTNAATMRDQLWGRNRVKELTEDYPFHRDVEK